MSESKVIEIAGKPVPPDKYAKMPPDPLDKIFGKLAPTPTLAPLDDMASGWWTILAEHLDTGRRFIFCIAGDSFERAQAHAREEAQLLDPLEGNWEFGSVHSDFDAEMAVSNDVPAIDELDPEDDPESIFYCPGCNAPIQYSLAMPQINDGSTVDLGPTGVPIVKPEDVLDKIMGIPKSTEPL